MPGSYRKLIQNLRSIQAERAEAAVDRDRLDWLESHPERVADVRDRMVAGSLRIREAIDESRAEHDACR